MNRYGRYFLSLLSLVVILSVSETIAQDNTTSKTLIVNGKTVDAAVVRVKGHSYVDIEGLAQGMGGSVTFEPNQITLTIPGAPPSEDAQPDEDGMSNGFQQIAVSTLAEMRGWRGAISTVVATGIPVVGTWPQDYHNRVEADLMQATLAVSTEPDRQALELLQKEYALLSEWADNVVGDRKAQSGARFVDPNSLQNDQSLAKISKCGQFLSSMIVGAYFYDDSSCQ